VTKILVTGGAGFIGSHVVETFLEKGFEVVILDDLSTGRESNLDPRVRFYKMDIRNPYVRNIYLDASKAKEECLVKTVVHFKVSEQPA